MSKSFLTPIRFANLSSDPTGQKGSVYFNDVDDVLKFYDGTTWSPISNSSGGAIVNIDGGNASSTYFISDVLDGGGA
jgi:hypothetical protein